PGHPRSARCARSSEHRSHDPGADELAATASQSRATAGMSDLIDLALREDIGGGDVTVRFFTDPSRTARASIVARVDCVAAGLAVAGEGVPRVDERLDVRPLCANGDVVSAGSAVLEVEGSLGSILTAERTALNFLQRLFAVATVTRRYVDAIAGTGCR